MMMWGGTVDVSRVSSDSSTRHPFDKRVRSCGQWRGRQGLVGGA